MASQNGTRLISDQFVVDLARPLREAAGGLLAFAAADRRSGKNDLMAVAVQRYATPRVRPLQILNAQHEGVLTPLSHGVGPPIAGEAACYVVSALPPGPSLAVGLQPWPEAALIEHVLRPAAHALERLQAAGVTHRAIRANNVFHASRAHPIVLGSAWASPPAMHQPAIYEPPYSAMCLPAARGEGSIADDVYALGVLLLILALGRVPLNDLDDATVLRRKVELGSYQALAGDARLSPAIADLTRGMLAEDPDHRPPPALLLDPAAARSRRVAARPPRRAQRPLPMAKMQVWDARSLAFALATESAAGLAAMIDGSVTQWLRRGLGDATLGSRVEELVRHRQNEGSDERGADAFTVMRVVTTLDPLAPLCWRGFAVWPDALGPALAAALDPQSNQDVARRLEELISLEATASWAVLRADRCDSTVIRLEARQNRALAQTRGPAGGVPRLIYALCPLFPCASTLLSAHWVASVDAMPIALEAVAETVDRESSPVDAHIAAFLAVRGERALDSEAGALATQGSPEVVMLARLRLLAQLQVRFHPKPLPKLAAWVAELCRPLITSWHNRTHRTTLERKLRELVEAGLLPPIVTLLDDAELRSQDEAGARQAAEALGRINAELQHIANGAEERSATARRIGQEIAAGAGLAALATMLMLAALR
jgi:eukaryotic-like serine/threonine-protein kinase